MKSLAKSGSDWVPFLKASGGGDEQERWKDGLKDPPTTGRARYEAAALENGGVCMFAEMVLLQFWTVNRYGRRSSRAAYRKYPRAIDAVRDAWQGRDAKLSERGVMTIQTGPDCWLRQRIRADGVWLRPNAWRQFKELLVGQKSFPRTRS